MADPFWQRWRRWIAFERTEAQARKRGDFDGAAAILLDYVADRRWDNAVAILHRSIPAYASGRPSLVPELAEVMVARSAEASPGREATWAAAAYGDTLRQLDPALAALVVDATRTHVAMPDVIARPAAVPSIERIEFLFDRIDDAAMRSEQVLAELRDQMLEVARAGLELASHVYERAQYAVDALEARGAQLAAAVMADIAAGAHMITHPDEADVAATWTRRAASLRTAFARTDLGPTLGPTLGGTLGGS